MRIFRARVPEYRTIYAAMLVLAVAAGALTTLCFAVLGRDVLRETPAADQVAIVAAYLGVLAILIPFAVRHHRLRVHTPLNRMRRLKMLLSRSGTEKRFPHRRIELLHRKSRRPGRRRIKRVLRGCPLGTVIVMNGPPPAVLPLPAGSTVSFEPVGVRPAEERTLDMLVLGYADPTQLQGERKPRTTGAARSSGASLQQRLTLAGRILLGVVAMCVLIGMVTMMTIRSIAYDPPTLLWAGIIGVLVAIVVTHADTYQWWLVPGGLALRRSSWWKRQPVIHCIRAAEASLLLDLDSGLTCASQAGLVRQMLTNRVVQMAILTGWLSPMRPPSEAEILAALGAESQTPAHD